MDLVNSSCQCHVDPIATTEVQFKCESGCVACRAARHCALSLSLSANAASKLSAPQNADSTRTRMSALQDSGQSLLDVTLPRGTITVYCIGMKIVRCGRIREEVARFNKKSIQNFFI